jgi:phenylalanyl-tRNA synthetase alpha chain
MEYNYPKIKEVAEKLMAPGRLKSTEVNVLRSSELKGLYAEIPNLPKEDRARFGKEVNKLKDELSTALDKLNHIDEEVTSIDISAPFDVNCSIDKRPRTMRSVLGSKHPLMTELENILDIFYRMGFSAIESRQIDDDFHMFSSLNFPEDHPARDDYDTFSTTNGLIAPAHTSTMQNRVLKMLKDNLSNNSPIAAIIPGRVFRNEDLDPRHEHTFYQLEGVYVDQNVTVGHLIATLKAFLESYYEQTLEVKIQPFYFPFTEPSFEFALSCPFCRKDGCHICGYSGWIELLGCGMIHPNVLKLAGIDPNKFTGFAWGCGIDRLVMMKYDIEDVRHFESARLEFLRQFK